MKKLKTRGILIGRLSVGSVSIREKEHREKVEKKKRLSVASAQTHENLRNKARYVIGGLYAEISRKKCWSPKMITFLELSKNRLKSCISA